MPKRIYSREIDALNYIVKVLIDSRKGYLKACEITHDDYVLRPRFLGCAQEREGLIKRFQAKVRALGGHPESNGGLLGEAHRGWMQFSALFMDDEQAALEAIDEGEAYLANQIEERLTRDRLEGEVRDLMVDAYRSASHGESFAEWQTRSPRARKS
jgi:uncharacterized protein (TIGR02284 family)